MSLSKQQLLRQADEKDLLADRFVSYAKGLAEHCDGPRRIFDGGRIWQGPAADRYSADLKSRSRETEELERDCQATASRLRSTAGDLRRQADQAPG